MSWISRLFRWCFEIPNDLSMSVTLCWCAVFQGELQQSSNCKPLWFLTCLSRAYCTWCYLFKAICTENILPPPPPISSSHWHLKSSNRPLRLNVVVPAVDVSPWRQQAINGVSSLPYWGSLPCHMWSFLQRLKQTRQNLINHTLVFINELKQTYCNSLPASLTEQMWFAPYFRRRLFLYYCTVKRHREDWMMLFYASPRTITDIWDNKVGLFTSVQQELETNCAWVRPTEPQSLQIKQRTNSYLTNRTSRAVAHQRKPSVNGSVTEESLHAAPHWWPLWYQLVWGKCSV